MYPHRALGDRLREQMQAHGAHPAKLAAACGVRTQSVYGWMRTGRIAKRHIPLIAHFFATPLQYWLTEDGRWQPRADMDEQRLLATYRALTDPFKARLLADAMHLLDLQDPPAGRAPTGQPPSPDTSH